jgi:hypothetical protein
MCENPCCSVKDCEISYGTCHCGCGGLTNLAKKTDCKAGALKNVPRRFISGHQRRTFSVLYIINDETGCWEWQGFKNERGYGSITVDGKSKRTHKHFYETLVGPIPTGMVLDHLCRNRGCVNPDHLEVVTNKENILRGQGLAAKNAKKTHCPQGHEYTFENTYRQSNNGRQCIMCRNLRRKNVTHNY